MSYLYIETEAALLQLCDTLRKSTWLTLDTEFIREETYYPQLCLLQVATDDVVACIDPLALPTLDPLLALLYDPAITKVLHSARQDLEIFHNLRGAPPSNIFDTQVAATLLGHGEQVGYGNLVQAMLGVELDKAHSRTDWAQRPLSPDQLDYAADDVRYLRDVYKRQLAELTQNGRLAWLQEDFAQLSDPHLYEPPLADIWLRLKGLNRLKGTQLAAARGLARWREQVARERNLPRRWVVNDDLLVEIARLRPGSEDQLRRIRGLEDKKVQRYGKAILHEVALANALPKAEWPTLEDRLRLTPQQDALVDILMGALKLCAGQHRVSATTLASRRELEQLVTGDAQVALLRGWRHELCGHQAELLLAGRASITLDHGAVTIRPQNE